MNHFILALVDWPKLMAQFHEQGVYEELQESAEDYDSLSSCAQNFLNSITEAADKEDAQNVTTGFLGQWSAFATAYADLRELRGEEFRAVGDALYGPFLSSMLDVQPRIKVKFDLPAEFKLLKAGGLVIAISPEECAALSALYEEHASSEVGMSDPHGIVNFEALRREWQDLLGRATQGGKGLLAIAEI